MYALKFYYQQEARMFYHLLPVIVLTASLNFKVPINKMNRQNAHLSKNLQLTPHQPFITRRARNLMSYCNGKVDPILVMNSIPCLLLAYLYKKGAINNSCVMTQSKYKKMC